MFVRFLLGLLLFASALASPAQSNYFQQELTYDIDVRLDDRRHELHGHLHLAYTNRAPHGLDSIVFHLWPRAYRSDATAFAQQQLRDGSTRFHFADEEQRGDMDSLAFRVDGRDARFRFTEEPDVGVLYLARTLVPGETVNIETPFRVKIPASFSRLGHVGESYQITQWYPKPAIYDEDGWHPMPYLDRGEFYSEFGGFEVTVTLPENYVVAATGVLQDEQERAWLLRKQDSTRRWLENGEPAGGYVEQEFPPSAEDTKTITYTAEDVHDFAWFADKRFHVLHDTLHLPLPAYVRGPYPEQRAQRGGDTLIDVWSFFTDTEAVLWKNSTDYLKRATRFYADKIGPYPYSQVTGVQSALSAGAGMEYPMITVIGLSRSDFALDRVLAHEVGHNWFYGILASNERDHAWMDEGLNSYYEGRYTRRFYPDRKEGISLPGGRIATELLGQRYLNRLGRAQPPATRADSFATINYWEASYGKPALVLRELEAKYGKAAIDSAFAAYYDEWKFRHPAPQNFFAAMEAELPGAGEYLSDAMLTTGRGAFNRQMLRPRRDGPLRLGLLTGQERPGTQLFALPLLGFNANDGLLAGLALHNRTLEPRRLEWILAPLYGFGSKNLAGFAGAHYRIRRPLRGVRQTVIAAGVQRFAYFEPTAERFDDLDLRYNYVRSALSVNHHLDYPAVSERRGRLYSRLVRIDAQRPDFTDTGELLDEPATRTTHFLIGGFEWAAEREINPISYGLRLEYKTGDRDQPLDEPHLRLEATHRGGYQYHRGRFIDWRVFAGYFIVNELRDRGAYPATGFSLVDNAASDYRFDDLYFGRNKGDGYEQQLEVRQGGFRAPVSPVFTWGRSNDYLAAVNLDADLPLPLPLSVYLDAGAYGFRPTTESEATTEINWVAGLSVNIVDQRLRLFVPLLTDERTGRLLDQRGNIFERLAIQISLSHALPWRWLDELP